ncbi:uncharacterized protein LOC135714645, partial [Ochlerotatus camptorhynchus]|uniref:uncharacterized protein LOC135714645 n=1 Tax=Ochlerotatus camptorhynchus TaxID=644619 RepID=UPI0031E0C209
MKASFHLPCAWKINLPPPQKPNANYLVHDLRVFFRHQLGLHRMTMVENALKKLKSSVSPGPDGIPACILKKCSGMLITPLQAIFNLSLRSQQFPIAKKMSYMQPIFKKGSKVDVSNYRGITSLPAGSKCFEIILNDVMFQACKMYISTSQHGFFPQRSVITNLCEYTSFCISEIEQGGQIDSIYTDIKAAFDSVNHDILLAKLERLGASSII